MELNNLPKSTTRNQKRLGRGHGSGRGKTAGRGTKGQKARGKLSISFEGGQQSIIKRLPLKRGKNRNKSFEKKALPVNVKVLNLLPKGTRVNIETLKKHHIIASDIDHVKILGDGELTVVLTVDLPCSHGASEKIKKAGGTVEKAK